MAGGGSDPVPVYDDGTADFAPRAVVSGGDVTCFGRMLTKNFPGTIDSSRIRAFDGSLCCGASGWTQVQEVTNLTEGIEGYCGMHNLAVVDGKVCAGWLVNDRGDLLFSEGQNRSYQAVYEQGTRHVQPEDGIADAHLGMGRRYS